LHRRLFTQAFCATTIGASVALARHGNDLGAGKRARLLIQHDNRLTLGQITRVALVRSPIAPSRTCADDLFLLFKEGNL